MKVLYTRDIFWLLFLPALSYLHPDEHSLLPTRPFSGSWLLVLLHDSFNLTRTSYVTTEFKVHTGTGEGHSGYRLQTMPPPSLLQIVQPLFTPLLACQWAHFADRIQALWCLWALGCSPCLGLAWNMVLGNSSSCAYGSHSFLPPLLKYPLSLRGDALNFSLGECIQSSLILSTFCSLILCVPQVYSFKTDSVRMPMGVR